MFLTLCEFYYELISHELRLLHEHLMMKHAIRIKLKGKSAKINPEKTI